MIIVGVAAMVNLSNVLSMYGKLDIVAGANWQYACCYCYRFCCCFFGAVCAVLAWFLCCVAYFCFFLLSFLVDRNVPTTFGMAVYAYEGIGVIIPSETAISKPKAFMKILIVCLLVSSFQYLAFGAIVYLGFGIDTHEQILLNVAHFAANSHFWVVLLMVITFLYDTLS